MNLTDNAHFLSVDLSIDFEIPALFGSRDVFLNLLKELLMFVSRE